MNEINSNSKFVTNKQQLHDEMNLIITTRR